MGSILEPSTCLGQVASMWSVLLSPFVKWSWRCCTLPLQHWERYEGVVKSSHYPNKWEISACRAGAFEMGKIKGWKCSHGVLVLLENWGAPCRWLWWIWLACLRFCWSKFRSGNNFPLWLVGNIVTFCLLDVWLSASGIKMLEISLAFLFFS